MPSAPQRTLPLTLVRHGQTDWNALHRVQGHNDEPRLSEKGRVQVAAVTETFRAEDFDLIVTSDLVRTQESTAIINAKLQLPVAVDSRLRERHYGIYEGGPGSALPRESTGIIDGVLVDPDARPADGESFRDVVARATAFLDRVSSEWSDKRLLVVTHGGMIRALRAAAIDETLEGLEWDHVGNCSVWLIQRSL